LAAMGPINLCFVNSRMTSSRLAAGLFELPAKRFHYLYRSFFERRGFAAAVQIGPWDVQLHFHTLVFAVLILVKTQVNVGRQDARMKEVQLLQFFLDETNQGRVGLEVNGLKLYLHVYHLRVRLQKMPRVSSGDPLCTSFIRLVVTWV